MIKKIILIFISVISITTFINADDSNSTISVYVKDGTYYTVSQDLMDKYRADIQKKYDKQLSDNNVNTDAVMGYVNNNLDKVLATVNNTKSITIDGISEQLISNIPYYIYIPDLDSNNVVAYTKEQFSEKLNNDSEIGNSFIQITFDSQRNMLRILTYDGRGGFLTIKDDVNLSIDNIKNTVSILIPEDDLIKIYNN